MTREFLGGLNKQAGSQGAIARDMGTRLLVVLPLLIADGLLATIARKVAGQSDTFQDLLEGHLFYPMGIKHEGHCSPS